MRRLEEVEALLEAAPPRPWWFGDDGVYSGRPVGGQYEKQPIVLRSPSVPWTDGVANIIVNGPNELEWAVARIKRLEAALKAAKRDHRFKLRPFFNSHEVCPADDSEDARVANERFHGRRGPCADSCGADAHNAAIDAALNEDS